MCIYAHGNLSLRYMCTKSRNQSKGSGVCGFRSSKGSGDGSWLYGLAHSSICGASQPTLTNTDTTRGWFEFGGETHL